MAEEVSAAPAPGAPAAEEEAAGKMTMVVGVDESESSAYALEWVLGHFFPPAQPHAYRLVVVTAKHASAPAVGPAGPGGAPVLFVDADATTETEGAARVLDHARELCARAGVADGDAAFEAVDGDARNVLCDAVDRHAADLLAVGSHGYGAIKRAFLGSVSDYCVHHAHCSVMIVKKPKHKH